MNFGYQNRVLQKKKLEAFNNQEEITTFTNTLKFLNSQEMLLNKIKSEDENSALRVEYNLI